MSSTASDQPLVGAQLMIDTATHASHLFRLERNEHCRFDHAVWKIDALTMSRQESTLADLFDAVDARSDSAISLEGHSFATTVACAACGRRSTIGLSLVGRLSTEERTCSCGGRLLAPGFFSFEAIRRSELSTNNLGLTLADLGLQSGDVISVTDGSGTARHIEIRDGAVQ